MGDYQDCLKNGKITLGMNFNKKMETNLLYGLPPRQAMACGGCSLESVGLKALIWWPRVSQKNETCWINKKFETDTQIKGGFKEVVAISEENKDEKENDEHLKMVLADECQQIRHVLFHELRKGVSWYKFYGVFKLNVEESKKRGLCYFERIATEVSLQKQGD